MRRLPWLLPVVSFQRETRPHRKFKCFSLWKYDITGVTDLTEETYETAHGGYDPVYANEDPDRVLPVDVLRDMEKEGVIGSLHHLFYTTVGNGTSVASAKAFAAEYSQKLKADGVDAVILTST